MYDFRLREIRFDKLDVVISKLKDAYGEEFADLLIWMVNEDP